MLAWAQKHRTAVFAAAGVTATAGALAYWYMRSLKGSDKAKALELPEAPAAASVRGEDVVDARKLAGRFNYPETRTVDHVDEYWGVSVPDPYRWLEDPDAPDVKKWVEQQNECTASYTKQYADLRDKLYTKLSDSFTYDKYSVPWQKGQFLFFSKKTGLQNQYVYYMYESVDDQPKVILDPNTLRADGTAAVKGPWISDDGLKMAYGVSLSGSDWFTIHVRDLQTCEDSCDVITWCKFSNVAWMKDSSGFFYSKYPRPSNTSGADDSAGTEVDAASGQRVYYHRLGTTEAEDQLVFEDASNAQWLYGCEVTDDGKTLMLSINDSCDPVNRLFLFDLSEFDGQDVSKIGPCVKLVDVFDHEFSYITNDGCEFTFKSNMNAPRYKVVKMTIPELSKAAGMQPEELTAVWKSCVDIVPQRESVLADVTVCAGNVLVLNYLEDVKEVLELCDLQGQRRTPLPLPSVGTVIGPTGIRDSNVIYYQFISFQDAGSIHMVELTADGDKIQFEDVPIRSTDVPGLDPREFETTQVFFESKDGTRIPMFIVRKAGADGKALPPTGPCLLYGYGGFNISITPHFSASRLLFVKHFNGIYCVANIRGGGEYGEEWHKQGSLHKKQNCFDDFIGAAEYLIRSGLTTSDRLAIQGGSNGGLLVGACINQRPDLFAVAVPQVGVMDMLKFHKFTIGYAWCSDYGCSENSKEEFETLYAYSPIHNIRPQSAQYPATLVLTADHDDRVVPLHSFKYIATLQRIIGSRPEQQKPLLVKIETKAGHGAGKPTHMMLGEAADIYAFVAHNTGARWLDA